MRKRFWESSFKLKAGEYTAKEVLESVIKTVEEEPKRLVMKSWLSALRGRIRKGVVLKPTALPECGTAACLGGWIGLKTGNYVDGSDDALNALGFTRFGGPLCSCSLCKGKNTPEVNLHSELSQLFMRTSWSAADVLPRLKAIVENYSGPLSRKKIRVPTREELRHGRA